MPTDFRGGDLFIDLTTSIDSSRIIYGALLPVSLFLTSYLLHSAYSSSVLSRIVRSKSSEVNLALVAPPHNLRDAIASHWLITGSLSSSSSGRSSRHGEPRRSLRFFLVSLLPFLVAIFTIFSTAIATLAISDNPTIRDHSVKGKLRSRTVAEIETGLEANVSAAMQAFDAAGAPDDQLFEFLPLVEDWRWNDGAFNSSWKGQCSYTLLPGVQLNVRPTSLAGMVPNATGTWNDFLPDLAQHLPSWATPSNPSSTFVSGVQTDDQQTWDYAFVPIVIGTLPASTQPTVVSFQYLFLSFVSTSLPTSPSTLSIGTTTLTTTLSLADCHFANLIPGPAGVTYQATYDNIASTFAGVFTGSLGDQLADANSNGGQAPLVAGKDMVRAWQSLVLVKDTQRELIVERTLPVYGPVPQIRVSAIWVPLFVLLLAAVIRAWAWMRAPRRSALVREGRVRVPKGGPDWLVQAAREYGRRTGDTRVAVEDLVFRFERDGGWIGVAEGSVGAGGSGGRKGGEMSPEVGRGDEAVEPFRPRGLGAAAVSSDQLSPGLAGEGRTLGVPTLPRRFSQGSAGGDDVWDDTRSDEGEKEVYGLSKGQGREGLMSVDLESPGAQSPGRRV